MENKINIAELLTDCPRGMELDCALFEGVYLKGIIDDEDIDYPILIRTKEGETWNITSEGCWDDSPSAKCIIFPKGKTTWEGFVPPCKFKDGDIIFTHTNSSKCNLDNCWVSIFKEYRNNRCACYVCLCLSGLELYHDKWEDELLCELCEIEENRLASEEEKEKLFQAIKDNGYKWNAETKTLEKLVEPKFKVGDWVTDGASKCQIYFIDDTQYWYSKNCILGSIESVDKLYHIWTIEDAKDGDVLFHSDSASNGIFIFKEILQRGTLQKVICYCDYDSEDGFCLGENHTCCWADSKILRPATEERRNRLFQKMREAGYKWNAETKTLDKLIEPSFKVGDKVRHKNNHGVVFTITSIEEDSYVCGAKAAFWFDDQDDYELVPNKFDITTLKPFDKVLVRDTDNSMWTATLFSHLRGMTFYTVGGWYNQCIPYEGNQHLLGTTDDCDEFYKTWEK